MSSGNHNTFRSKTRLSNSQLPILPPLVFFDIYREICWFHWIHIYRCVIISFEDFENHKIREMQRANFACCICVLPPFACWAVFAARWLTVSNDFTSILTFQASYMPYYAGIENSTSLSLYSIARLFVFIICHCFDSPVNKEPDWLLLKRICTCGVRSNEHQFYS